MALSNLLYIRLQNAGVISSYFSNHIDLVMGYFPKMDFHRVAVIVVGIAIKPLL